MISQIPTLIAHIWQTRSWQIYHPKVAISQIPPLRTHIWQVRSGHIYPNPLQWFHRFLLWELIFGRPGLRRSILSNGNVTDSYSEGSYLADQVLADLPSPTLRVISQIPYLRTHIWQVRSGHIYPNPPQWFHRFLLWELIFGRPGLCISSIPQPNSDFTDSYSESSYLADQVFAYLPSPTQTVISQIPTLRAHIWQARSWKIYLSPWMLILQIPTLRVHIWQTRSR